VNIPNSYRSIPLLSQPAIGLADDALDDDEG
jgi:hypothetical protein